MYVIKLASDNEAGRRDATHAAEAADLLALARSTCCSSGGGGKTLEIVAVW